MGLYVRGRGRQTLLPEPPNSLWMLSPSRPSILKRLYSSFLPPAAALSCHPSPLFVMGDSGLHCSAIMGSPKCKHHACPAESMLYRCEGAVPLLTRCHFCIGFDASHFAAIVNAWSGAVIAAFLGVVILILLACLPHESWLLRSLQCS